ncbi:MAG TPA: YcaO-like family protein [Solirubrobacteraceae bacterium]|nr:YcaO-like family protein [Solirubrobacteraceae bacterium]HXB15421.1 YcaO-like family protein [Solirubrobacteraceae bacterium]
MLARLDFDWSPSNSIGGDAESDIRALGGRYFNLPPFHDELKLFHVAVLLPGSEQWKGLQRAGGTSWEFRRALQKAAGEAVERLSAFPPDSWLSEPIAASSLGDRARLIPEQFAFSRAPASPSSGDRVRWVDGLRLSPQAATPGLVPAQLVYLPYNGDEPMWLQPTSNGLAAGRQIEQATWNAILELLERDALMRCWWGAARPRRLPDPRGTGACPDELGQLLARSDDYRFSAEFLSLPSIAGVTVAACVLRDLTGIGPPSTLGFKTASDPNVALHGALEEAHQLRPWLRELMEEGEAPPARLKTVEDRARWWLTGEAQSALNVWLAAAEQARPALQMTTPAPLTLGGLIAALEADGHEPWIVPLRAPISGYSAVRAIVPTLQPAYFDEDYEALVSGLSQSTVARHPLL